MELAQDSGQDAAAGAGAPAPLGKAPRSATEAPATQAASGKKAKASTAPAQPKVAAKGATGDGNKATKIAKRGSTTSDAAPPPVRPDDKAKAAKPKAKGKA